MFACTALLKISASIKTTHNFLGHISLLKNVEVAITSNNGPSEKRTTSVHAADRSLAPD